MMHELIYLYIRALLMSVPSADAEICDAYSIETVPT